MKKSNSEEEVPLNPKKMLPIDICRAMMNKRGIKYTDEEITIIREFLYRMAEMTIQHFEKVQENKSQIIHLTENNDHEKTESVFIHQSKHRRAS